MESVGVKIKRTKKLRAKYPDIIKMLEEGKSFSDIGATVGRTKERIRQINEAMGFQTKWEMARERVRKVKENKELESMFAINKKNYPDEYQAWASAKQRCTNLKHTQYDDYGGRGIRFLFNDFTQFMIELGERPEGKSLDRIDNDGHYEPDNVKWSTQKEQCNNRRIRKSQGKSDLRVLTIDNAVL